MAGPDKPALPAMHAYVVNPTGILNCTLSTLSHCKVECPVISMLIGSL